MVRRNLSLLRNPRIKNTSNDNIFICNLVIFRKKLVLFKLNSFKQQAKLITEKVKEVKDFIKSELKDIQIIGDPQVISQLK
jgi:hypothetical protein